MRSERCIIINNISQVPHSWQLGAHSLSLIPLILTIFTLKFNDSLLLTNLYMGCFCLVFRLRIPSCFVIKMSWVLLLVCRNTISVSFCLTDSRRRHCRVNLFVCLFSFSQYYGWPGWWGVGGERSGLVCHILYSGWVVECHYHHCYCPTHTLPEWFINCKIYFILDSLYTNIGIY